MKLSINAAKANFFDSDRVIRAVGKARAASLAKAGYLVMKKARASLHSAPKGASGTQKRNAKGQFLKVKTGPTRSSPPGSPPYSRKGLIKKFLFFSYDQSSQTVVIGPTLINKPTGAPETLEYGGDAEIEESRFVSGVKYGNRTQRLKTSRKITIAARPYMHPALNAEAPAFASLWKNSVR